MSLEVCCDESYQKEFVPALSVPPLVIYSASKEYKDHYEKYYCQEQIKTFDDIRVYFGKTKYEHAFYESSARDGKKDIFSIERAKRIDWIKATLAHPHAEVYQGWAKKTKTYDSNRRVGIIYESFVVVIQIAKRDHTNKPLTANFITAYVADNSIKKIRKSPRWTT